MDEKKDKKEIEKSEEIKEEPNFPAIWEEIKKMKYLPVDKWLDSHKQLMLPFPKEVKLISEEHLESGEKLITYRVKSLLEKMDIIFIIPKGEDLPSFHRYAQSVFFSMIPFAMVQKTLNPYIKKEHQYKLLGEKTHYYEYIDEILKTLATGYWDYENNKKGKEYRRSIGHLVNSVELFGKGKGSYYKVEMNPTIMESLKSIIEGKRGSEIPSFVMYPLKTLQQKPTRKTRAGESVLRYRGLKRIFPIQIRTFLTRMGISKKEIEIKSLKYLMGMLEKGLEEVKKQGFDWELDQESFTIPKILMKAETVKNKGFIYVLEKYKEFKKDPNILKILIKKGLSPVLHKKDFLKWRLIFKEKQKN